MNVLASECSGDCESGWTLYLEQSFLSPNATHRDRGTKFIDDAKGGGFCDNKGKNVKEQNEEEEEEEEYEEEEEEDLSMVSDASSGPPHFHEDEAYFNYDNGYFYPALKDTTLPNNAGSKRPKLKERRRREDQELTSFLDDTASSPAFNFSKNNNFGLANNQASMESVLDYSQGFSATHFEGRSAFQDHFGYIQQPSLSGNQFQNNQWF